MKHSTTSAYQEPQGWKGTPGEWYVELHDENMPRYFGNIISNMGKTKEGYTNIRTIDILLNHAGKEEMAANAALIAQAKELAKATADLIALAETLQSEVSGLSADTEYENSQPYDAWQSRIQSAKQTLIKAGLNQ